MLNCTDVLCILHRHDEHIQSLLQDHRAHHEHAVQVMSGEVIGSLPDDQVIKNYYNGTTDTELSSLSHLDDPNEGLYMLCGVLIAMLFVGVIIVLLAVTISKLRKREDSAVVNNNNNQQTSNQNNNINNSNNQPQVVSATVPGLQQQTPTVPIEPPPFLWRYSNGSSQIGLCNNDQLQTSVSLPEEESECRKGFRKNLRGKWRRLVKRKPEQEIYTIPAEYRDQLKQIYVY